MRPEPGVIDWRPTLSDYEHSPDIPEQQFDREYPLYKLQEAGLTEEQFEKVADFMIRNSSAEELAQAPGIGIVKATELESNLKKQSGIITLDDFSSSDKIDWVKIHDELNIEGIGNPRNSSISIREAMLKKYVDHPRGFSKDNCKRVPSVDPKTKGQIHSEIYRFGGFEFGIMAPGKEAMKDWTTKSYEPDKNERKQRSNHNDALPVVTKHGKRVWEKELTFKEIFQMLEKCGEKDEDGLLILAAILYRMAFCLDHVNESNPKLQIPSYSHSVLMAKIGAINNKDIGNIPIDVFVHWIDILATNEDAKVHALGWEKFDRKGRPNTILTCVNVISVIQGDAGFIQFADKMARNRGMAPITDTLTKSCVFSIIKQKSMLQ